ncbi:MAG: stage III sporulation protein AF [Clostridia bacterium]|nr:stage III sporulation protein AF [Clostridia bacterium]
MSAWLSGIVGIICLGLLLEIVLPDGQTTKYVRGAFSLLVILVVVAPLPKLLGGDFTLVFDGAEYTYDQGYIDGVHNDYEDSLEDSVERTLVAQGYTCQVTVVAKSGILREIDAVQVKINFSGIDGEDVNTYISRVRALVANLIGIDESRVEVKIGSD